MTTFLDGPAQGITLRLKAAPLFLRVTQNGPNFDALDMPSDEPDDMEIIYVYLRVANNGIIHINAKGGTGGTFTSASYKLLDRQPTDEEARIRELWQAWAIRVQALRKEERADDPATLDKARRQVADQTIERIHELLRTDHAGLRFTPSQGQLLCARIMAHATLPES